MNEEHREPGQDGEGNAANRVIEVGAKPKPREWIPFKEVAKKLGMTKPELRRHIKDMGRWEDGVKIEDKDAYVCGLLAGELYAGIVEQPKKERKKRIVMVDGGKCAKAIEQEASRYTYPVMDTAQHHVSITIKSLQEKIDKFQQAIEVLKTIGA